MSLRNQKLLGIERNLLSRWFTTQEPQNNRPESPQICNVEPNTRISPGYLISANNVQENCCFVPIWFLKLKSKSQSVKCVPPFKQQIPMSQCSCKDVQINRRWKMVGCDLFEFRRCHYLLYIDYCSKWTDI